MTTDSKEQMSAECTAAEGHVRCAERGLVGGDWSARIDGSL